MSQQLDHFRYGTVAMNAASSAIPVNSGAAYFGVLILQDGTTFTELLTDATNSSVLQGLTYDKGMYLPVAVNAVDVSAGAVLIGKTGKR